MKEEITKASVAHAYERGKVKSAIQDIVVNAAADFETGANWMLDQYNGLSPSTVAEMVEALRAIRKRSSMDGMESEDELITYLNVIKSVAITAISKADKELKK